MTIEAGGPQSSRVRLTARSTSQHQTCNRCPWLMCKRQYLLPPFMTGELHYGHAPGHGPVVRNAYFGSQRALIYQSQEGRLASTTSLLYRATLSTRGRERPKRFPRHDLRFQGSSGIRPRRLTQR
ncbi:hypothetical protein EJ03DRAFT_187832 [Teratosphaeria nubilosa]|uniref:Uncharacterized protein n=1 Tax=Teratosphaeria nubilosa TaxID=161662 RepID=A0A6G1LI47_9PEZI|nr:hypothetical protein EJ03DRAFT_187832 [Teratosphaeria nubilosa]